MKSQEVCVLSLAVVLLAVFKNFNQPRVLGKQRVVLPTLAADKKDVVCKYASTRSLFCHNIIAYYCAGPQICLVHVVQQRGKGMGAVGTGFLEHSLDQQPD